MWRQQVKQRLDIAKEKILGIVEKAADDNKEELSCVAKTEEHNRSLAAVNHPNDELFLLVIPADVQQTMLIKQEAPEEWRPAVDQKIQETLNIKKEEEELCISLEEEQLSVKEETDATRFPLTAVSLKRVKDEENPLFPQLYQHQSGKHGDLPTSSLMDQITTAPGVKDCGGAETTKNPDLNTNKYDSSSSETDVTEDDEEDEDANNTDSQLQHVSDSGQKSFRCDECGRRFTRKFHLHTHMRIHTGQKPFSCEICGQSFRHKSTLNIHTRIHTGQKPFCCEVCGQSFSLKAHLNSHMRVHTGQKPFWCEVCEKRFSEKSNLNKHMRIHTGQKPFSCEVCGQNFRHKSTLNTHMRIHTGHKPFWCEVCEKRFSVLSSLNKHMRIHTDRNCFLVNIETLRDTHD